MITTRTKSGFSPRATFSIVLVFALIAEAICFGACSRSRETGANANVAATPAQKKSVADMAKPFNLGTKEFDSQLRFVEEIRPRCATEEPPPTQRRQIEVRIEGMRKSFPVERQPGSVEIPVYVHIITNAAGIEGNIPDTDVLKQIDVLNVAYAGNGPGGSGAPTPFRFTLVNIDRTPNDAWFNMAFSPEPTKEERDAKAALNKGGKSALNLYTAKLADETLGWARWPWEIANGVDGVVVRFSTLPGGTTTFYNEGDTATHEIAHWLGVFHTFQGGCEDPGDQVDDTAAERSPAGGCPEARDTCPAQPGGDPVQNFMDYTNDSCMFMFTAGQASRMDATHRKYRQ
jgi:hypothetical protein